MDRRQPEFLNDPLWTPEKTIEVSNALMVIPPKEWQEDTILMWMAVGMKAAVFIFVVLALIWRSALIVKRWKCLAKENESLKEQNMVLKDICETFASALDLHEKESKRELQKVRKQMTEEMNNFKATLENEITRQKENIASIYSTYDTILELQQHEMDTLQRKLSQVHSERHEKDVKMVDCVLQEESMKFKWEELEVETTTEE
ncbi:uncharacterized protein LOC118228337 [Anguilla anguilla]|uniref:uncharacterized protein LOC118228337 n=1 Tax=Anguilla anguilla TaxID=7936 RepID=UPI0015ACE285|nr:uncharacterized protein LOC118228337 [Anguilla anguilla]